MNKNFWLIALLLVIVLTGFGSCTEKQDDPWVNEYDGSPIVCRYVGCGEPPVYSEWERRFCYTHINGTKHCRYPGCMNEISKSDTSRHCYKHK